MSPRAPPHAPSTCWLTPSARPQPSPIEGLGLFAQAPIGRGAVVLSFGGRVIDDDQLAALQPPYSSLTLTEGWHLLLDPAHPVRYVNHACDPTLWLRDATTVIARRDIAGGAELTLDYATLTGAETWSMACACGAGGCRGRITGGDWRRRDLQARYGRRWSPTLLARIEAIS